MRAFDKFKVPVPLASHSLCFSKKTFIEIGAGQGLFAVRFAQENPSTQLIAIERTKLKFEKLVRRIENNGYSESVLAIHGDAVNWISHHIPDESVEGYFLMYPNPYPKRSQRNKRFHAMPFTEEMIRSLKKGGKLHLVTNQNFYVKEAAEYYTKVWKLEPIHMESFDQRVHPRTHFEKKYLNRGERCYELIVQKP